MSEEKRKIEKVDTLQSVELAEGVEIQLRIAGPFVRALALLLDTIFLFLLTILVMLVLGWTLSFMGDRVVSGVLKITGFIFAWFYFFFFETGKRAATWGKRIMGLRVVDASGVPASRGQVLGRNLLRAADMLPGFVLGYMGMMWGAYGLGLLAALFTPRFQRIGDLACNTVVIYDKPVRHYASPLPPALQTVAPNVVLSREEQVALMAFKERAGIWSEARRLELADHASELTGAVGAEGMGRLVGMSKWLSQRE